MSEQMNSKEPIAIVGVGCRLPGQSNSPKEFWQMLMNKIDAVVDVPADRWDKDAMYHPDYTVPGKINVKQGGFIDEIDLFDAQFFGISPIEAVRVDPQQRILLENVYMAAEDAGVKVEDLWGSKTGVFIGISAHDYGDLQHAYSERTNLGAQSMQGGASSIASNRISYVFNLQGPSFSVDTACSSSLYALNSAVRSIWYGESDMAFVGGVNSLLKPEPEMAFSKGGFLSPDARCKAFDAKANGYIRSEGSGVVLLKPLSKAVEDGDDIYCTIIGSATNEDGRTDGLAKPNPDAQVRALLDAYKDAGLDPAKVHYIEAHGTGTAVGDPIEAEGIGKVIGKKKADGDKLIVGSVKSNVGHLEPASGIAGLIKLALTMKNRTVPPNIHFETPNPKIPFDEYKIKVPTEPEALPKTGTIYAGINSFGFGGANAHVVLQSAPEKEEVKPTPDDGNAKLFTMSARSEDALNDLANKYIEYLEGTEDSLHDMCYSAATRRSAHDTRLAIAAHDKAELAENIKAFLNDEERVGMSFGRPLNETAKTVFVFSGQGPQWYAMGRELLEKSDIFKSTVEKINELLSGLGWLKDDNSSLMKELMKDEESSRINETVIAQPAIFAVQVGLTELLYSMGVKPEAIVGHSIGECAAAYASGALSLEEATRVIFHRSKSQTVAAGKGKMMAVAMSEKDAKKEVKNYNDVVSVAVVNGPKMVTLSGDTTALETIAEGLEKRDIFHRMLRMDVPFHSVFLEEIKDDFISNLGEVKTSETTVPLYSTVTAKEIDGKELTAEYWFRNIREAVLFYPAIKEMTKSSYNTFVEISPHPILANSINDTLEEQRKKGVAIPTLRRKEEELRALQGTVGAYFAWGAQPDFKKLFESGKRVELPNYVWQKESFWLEKDESKAVRMGTFDHPHLKSARNTAKEPDVFVWDIELDKRKDPYIEDHRVQGPLVYPGAGHVDLTISAGTRSFGENFGFIEDFNFETALFLPDKGEPYGVQLEMNSLEGDFIISTKQHHEGALWTEHSNGKINHIGDSFVAEKVDLDEIKNRVTEKVVLDNMYSGLVDGGLQLGPTFQGVKELYRGELESLGLIKVHDGIKYNYEHFSIHPAILDACFQTAFGIYKPKYPGDKLGVYIPVHIERIKFYQKPKGYSVWSYAKAIEFDEDHILANLWIHDEEGNLVAEFQGFECKYLKGSKGEVAGEMDNWFYEYTWNQKLRYDEEMNRHPAKYIKSPHDIKKPVQGLIDEILARPIDKRFLDVFEPDLDKITGMYINDAMKEMAIEADYATDFRVGTEFTTEELRDRFKVVERHYRLFTHMLNILKIQGYLERLGENKWKVVKLPEEQPAIERMKELQEKHPEFTYELDLLERTGPAIKDVIQGTTDPVQLIFPEKDWDKVVEYYIHAHSFSKYNEILSKAVEEMIKDLPEEQTLRVLEIGSGTGGMTQAVLPKLPAERTQYMFTDLSHMFLMQAQNRFKKYPFVQYDILDIEKDPEEQGIIPNSYDLVIASDVIHATRDLRVTLANVQKILAPKGVLTMLEVTKAPIYLDLIFGMTEGWWLYEDDIRDEHCTMPRDKWFKLLNEIGFSEIEGMTDVERGDRSSQTVLMCRNDAVEEKVREASETEKTKGSWLVFEDGKGFSDKLGGKLKAKDKDVFTVKAGSAFSDKDGEFEIDKLSADDMKKLLESVESGSENFQGIVFAWPLDMAKPDETDEKRLDSDQDMLFAIVNMINVLAEKKESPRLYIVTSGSEDPIGNGPVNMAQGTLWGLARVAINEQPTVPTVIADLSMDIEDDEIENFFNEIMSDPGAYTEEEVAFRGKKRYTHIFDNVNSAIADEEAKKRVDALGSYYHTEIVEHGVLDTIVLRELPKPEVADDDIEIEVHSVGLNFRDVMMAMGLLADEAVSGGLFGQYFGLEAAGKVISVGKGVKGYKAGDEVLAFASDCLSGVITAKEYHVVKKPSHMSFQEAVTVPMVYLTAYYGLNHLARMSEGERVLIHAAAGGVGIAAIKLAQAAGAEVYATAGSERKRDFLKSLGVKNIYNSRSLDFKDKILEDTNGEGVDIVLNSLAGKFLLQSINCLAPYGRFVEIGKNDIYGNTRIGLKPFGNNLSYFAVDVDRMLEQKPKQAGKLFKEVMQFFEEKKFEGHPYKEFDVSEVSEAYRYMTQAKHIGKVIVSMKEGAKLDVSPPAELELNENATYLIVGGCGGFGLAVSNWMTGKGAKNIVLMGRSGVKNEEEQHIVDDMKARGINVVVKKGDVNSKEDVEKIISEIKQSMPPLKGVVNSAMVLLDSMLSSMTYDKFMKTMRPKVVGTWNLHNATKDIDLDYFIMFSSVAAQYGTPGQSNYAAANTFLDRFAHYRKSLGLPALTISWGVLAEVGFVSKSDKVHTILSSQGWEAFNLKESTGILEKFMLQKPVQRGAIAADWDKVKVTFPHSMNSYRFSHLYVDSDSGQMGGGNAKLKDTILSAADNTAREDILLPELKEAVARVVGMSSSKLDINTPLNKMGLDSLMSNQLRSWINNNTGVDYSMMRIMQGPSITELTQQILDSLGDAEGEAADAGDTDKWIIKLNPNDAADSRLFCFSYLGGGASVFNQWAESIPENVEVCVVQLPGREERSGETPIDNNEELSDILTDMIASMSDKPFSFYGHSFGGGLCFNLALDLEQKKGIMPENVFIGASPAPHLDNPLAKIFDGVDDSRKENIPDENVFELMRRLGISDDVINDPQWREESLEMVKADTVLMRNRRMPEGEKTSAKLTIFGGEKDNVYPADTMLKDWEVYAGSGFELKVVPGGHFFFTEDEGREALIKEIAARIANQ